MQKRVSFTAAFILYINFVCQSQNYHITTQAALDNFATSGIPNINLYIGPDSCCSDINDLTPLIDLQGVGGGQLTIQNNPRLKSLHGLENCSTLGYFPWLEINNNDSLVNLEGLAPLLIRDSDPWTHHIIVITNNDRLENLKGFPKLDRESNSSFTVNNNQQLRDFTGLDHLSQIGGLTIRGSANLMSFNGLQSLDTLYDLNMSDCPRVKNFSGFDSLRLFYAVNLQGLDSLETTAGMERLNSIYTLDIKECHRLKRIEGLHNLRGRVDMLTIWANQLTDFSGWSDSCQVRIFSFSSDSIADISTLHHVHAEDILISGCASLRYMHSIPTGAKDELYFTPSPILTIQSCPQLEFIHHPDTLIQPNDWESISIYGGAWSLPNSITDISGFSFLKKIKKNLFISKTLITDLHGLENLEEADGIALYHNTKLKSISLLSNVGHLNSGIVLSGNTLENLQGLEQLDTLGVLEVSYDDSIQDLSAVHKIRKINTLQINHLPHIEVLDGFDSLYTTMGKNVWAYGYLTILNMPNLKKITGFNNLKSIKYRTTGTPKVNLLIQNNPFLEEISGLRSLNNLDAGIHLIDNPSLTDLSGLCPLFKYGHLSLDYNLFEGNGSGLNSLSQIRTGCDTILDATTAINIKSNINIYPNPASRLVTIDFVDSDWDNFEMVSIMGNTVYQLKNVNRTSKIEVNLDNFKNGYYLLKVSKGNRIIDTKKLIIINGQ